jgi:hypothetical protein
MGLDDLAQVVARVRETARKHQALLSQNEVLTRYCLIDPLLRALGWDTTDPEQVRVEEGAGGGKADYVLLDSDGSYLVLIEAKRLAQKLPPVATTEVIKYAGFLLREGKAVKQLAITNGLLWEVNEYPSLSPLHKLDINDPKKRPQEAALELARALWRPLLYNPPPAPLVGSPPERTVTLLELHELVRNGSPPPKAILFPDGKRQPIKWWKSLLTSVAEYLIAASPQSLKPPIMVPKGKTYLIHTQPVHPSGRQFTSPYQLGSLYLETFWDATTMVRMAVHLVGKAGRDPDQFRVELGP